MNVMTAFWVSAATTAAGSVLIVLLLRSPLDVLLVELCGSASRARFWLVFSSVTIVLTALLGMLVAFPLSRDESWSEFPQLPVVLGAVRTSLLFLLMALGGLALVLLLGIRNYERNRAWAQRAAVDPAVRASG